jgi:hypothetical protein
LVSITTLIIHESDWPAFSPFQPKRFTHELPQGAALLLGEPLGRFELLRR